MDIASLVARPNFIAKEPGGHGEPYGASELVTRLVILRQKDPALFLERYGGFLRGDELSHFDGLADDYEVGWHLKRLRKSASQTTCRNRRFRYLEELEARGEYFSDHAMRQRAPQLYYQFIGRFADDEQLAFREDESLSERLLANIDVEESRKERLVAEAAEAMEATEEEEDSTDDDHGDGIHVMNSRPVVVPRGSEIAPHLSTSASGNLDVEEMDEVEDQEDYISCGNEILEAERRAEERRQLNQEAVDADAAVAPAVAAAQAAAARLAAEEEARRQSLREEFVRLMRERFLNGEDCAFFDYPAVDDNERYDDTEQQSRDAEERWFDDDSDEEL
ncbi:hypothetical protein AB1Y20_004583 [Prymnesium parvum]|uniref:CCD97-like C-terminal domain-containing protein n=1 Tax=Prymnesium parvum TaxID=97485 RepID=A0AB34IZ57_PRYPA